MPKIENEYCIVKNCENQSIVITASPRLYCESYVKTANAVLRYERYKVFPAFSVRGLNDDIERLEKNPFNIARNEIKKSKKFTTSNGTSVINRKERDEEKDDIKINKLLDKYFSKFYSIL
jgi:hypothetical protein